MFRKTARVQSLGAFGTDFRFVRKAQRANGSEVDGATSGASGAGVSYFLDGARKLDVRGLLERVADLYAIDPDPSNYFFEAIRANTTNAPNENNDGFHQSELLRFDVRLGMPVYMTYAGKPHHLNHRTENPKAARGVLIDAHYNTDAPALETCPSCKRRTADRQNRDSTGLHCKCGALVKDEFVEILVGIDAKKDPLFAEGVRKGTLRAGSMGCNCLSTVCNVCQHVAYSKPEFCEHIRAGNKGSLWRRKGNVWVKTSAPEITRELGRHKLSYVPNDFCYVTAPDFEARRAFEYCTGVIFDEYSRVDQPADPKALQVEVLKAAQVVSDSSLASDAPDPQLLQRETEALIHSADAKRKEHRMKSAARKKTAGRFVVVRVNADDRDTFAAASLEEALDLAQADEGDKIEYGLVEAPDAGAARLMKPEHWTMVPTEPKDKDGLESEAINIHLEEGDEPVVIEPPGGNGAPGAPGAPGGAPSPESIEQYTEKEMPMGAPPQDEQMDAEEMGVLPVPPGASKQGAFRQAYASWRVQVSEQGNARLLTGDRTPVFVMKAKAAQDPEARAAFGRQVLADLLVHGLVHTARKYRAAFSPKFAQVVSGGMNDMAGFDDHEMFASPLDGGMSDIGKARHAPPKSIHDEDGDDMAGDVRGAPPKDVAEGGAMDHAHDSGPDSAVGEDHETMREKRKPFSMNKNTVLEDEVHDHKEPLKKKSEAGPEMAKSAESLRIKRLERVAEAKLAKAEAMLKRANVEAEAQAKVASEAAVTAFCRALRIAARRQAADLELSPLKQAAEAVLSEPRVIGKDAATGSPIEYQGLDPELTRYLVAQLYSVGHDDHLEQLVRRARELTQKGDQYLIDAESDLRNVQASIPEVTNARVAELDEVGLRALELRARAQEGNLQFNPTPSDIAAGNGHDRRAAIRGALGGTLVEAARGRLGLN